MRGAIVACLLLSACTSASVPGDAATDLGGDAGDADTRDLSACVDPPPASASCVVDAGPPAFDPHICDGFPRLTCANAAAAAVGGCFVGYGTCAAFDGGSICVASSDHSCFGGPGPGCNCGSGPACPPGQLCVSPARGGAPRCACAADVAP